MGNFKEEIARVRVFVLDVDGVLTDGRILVTAEGDFLRNFNAKDGFALAYAIRKGYQVAIITGGFGRSLEKRFEMLRIDNVYFHCARKLDALHDLMRKLGVGADEMLYMGDDIPDIEPMRAVAMPVCPADASTEVVSISKYVSQFRGGEGCVRDVIEQVLRARGDWYVPGEHVVAASR